MVLYIEGMWFWVESRTEQEKLRVSELYATWPLWEMLHLLKAHFLIL